MNCPHRCSTLGFAIALNLAIGLCFLAGCCCTQKPSPSITAVGLSPGNRCEPDGIPYYLPKPLLVIAKNFRHIDESKVGLTQSAPIPNAFDSQASYADIKANITVPGDGAAGLDATRIPASNLPGKFDAHPSSLPDYREQMVPEGRLADGIAPDCFYTYQIIFVPDLSQKYGLRIQGGAGEIRAAMNLVNGWMYTGMGPYYIKDSSTAQNTMSAGVASLYAGRGVADVLNEVGELASIGGSGQSRNFQSGSDRSKSLEANTLIDRCTALAKALQTESPVPQSMLNYAEIFIYEPVLTPDGSSEWKMIAQHSFDRQYFQPGMNETGMKLFGQILKADQAERNDLKKASETERLPAPQTDKTRGDAESGASESDDFPPGMENQSLEDAFKRQILLDGPSPAKAESTRQTSMTTSVPAGNQVQVNVDALPPRRGLLWRTHEPGCNSWPRLFARPTAKQSTRVGSALEMADLDFAPAAYGPAGDPAAPNEDF